MSLEKEKLLISYLMNDPQLFIKVNPILKSSYFDTTLKKVITFTQNYYDEYKSLPTHIQLSVETGIILPTVTNLPSEIRYAENELETFCRDKAIEHAIYASVDLLKDQKLSEIEKLIRDAITISLQRHLGTDYFENPEARLNHLLNQGSLISTGYKDLDDAFDGGFYRKGIYIFSANSGVGKSITMSNVARNFCLQNLHGIYFSFELSEEMVSKRLDSIFTGISHANLLKDITRTSIEVNKIKELSGSLLVKRYPESVTTSNQLRAYLKEYELVYGRVPDFIVTDYLDLMASNNSSISVENQFIKDKYVTEELRSIANDYDCIMITASQLNRGALQIESLEDLTQAAVAGGISKANTCDGLIAIIQTPQMKARNELVFKMLKVRAGPGTGRYFILKNDPLSLRITDLEESNPSKGMADKISAFKKPNQSYQKPQEKASISSPPWASGSAFDDVFKV